MTKLRRMLSENEKILGRAQLHWIHICKGLIWFFLLSGFGIFFDHFIVTEELLYFLHPDIANIFGYRMVLGISTFEWICIGGGFALFLVYYFKYTSTYIWLTSRRIIYKTGLIFVKIKETDLQEIKEERVDQGWFGSILDYGAVVLDCRFVEDLHLPEIDDPLGFMKVVYKAREHLSKEAAIE